MSKEIAPGALHAVLLHTVRTVVKVHTQTVRSASARVWFVRCVVCVRQQTSRRGSAHQRRPSSAQSELGNAGSNIADLLVSSGCAVRYASEDARVHRNSRYTFGRNKIELRVRVNVVYIGERFYIICVLVLKQVCVFVCRILFV